MLVKIANKDTESVVSALIKQSRKLPGELYQSLTWDRGKELADHKRLALASPSVLQRSVEPTNMSGR
jgi:IS30 family transposase